MADSLLHHGVCSRMSVYNGIDDGIKHRAIERRGDVIKVTVIPSKDPPEVVQKRLEDAVRRFFLAVEKEKAQLPVKVESAK